MENAWPGHMPHRHIGSVSNLIVHAIKLSLQASRKLFGSQTQMSTIKPTAYSLFTKHHNFNMRGLAFIVVYCLDHMLVYEENCCSNVCTLRHKQGGLLALLSFCSCHCVTVARLCADLTRCLQCALFLTMPNVKRPQGPQYTVWRLCSGLLQQLQSSLLSHVLFPIAM